MLRNYQDKSDAPPSEAPAKPDATASPDPLQELQRRYAKTLAACYALYAEGSRCRFEDDPEKVFDCSHCRHNNADKFCKANLHLKKVVGLVAEYLASKARSLKPTAADEGEKLPPAPLTQDDIDNFTAKGIAYELESPLCDEPIWIVPCKTNKDRIEFTPEEMNFLIQAANAVHGKFIAIAKKPATLSGPDGEDGGEAQ